MTSAHANIVGNGLFESAQPQHERAKRPSRWDSNPLPPGSQVS